MKKIIVVLFFLSIIFTLKLTKKDYEKIRIFKGLTKENQRTLVENFKNVQKKNINGSLLNKRNGIVVNNVKGNQKIKKKGQDNQDNHDNQGIFIIKLKVTMKVKIKKVKVKEPMMVQQKNKLKVH